MNLWPRLSAGEACSVVDGTSDGGSVAGAGAGAGVGVGVGVGVGADASDAVSTPASPAPSPPVPPPGYAEFEFGPGPHVLTVETLPPVLDAEAVYLYARFNVGANGRVVTSRACTASSV